MPKIFTFNLHNILNILLFVLSVFSIYINFHIKSNVILIEEEIKKIEYKVSKEKTTIKSLELEFNKLLLPSRLVTISEKFLNLKKPLLSQIKSDPLKTL